MFCCRAPTNLESDALEIPIQKSLRQTQEWINRSRDQKARNDKMRQQNGVRRKQLESERSVLVVERDKLESELQKIRLELASLGVHFKALEDAEEEVRISEQCITEDEENIEQLETSIRGHLVSLVDLTSDNSGTAVPMSYHTTGGGCSGGAYSNSRSGCCSTTYPNVSGSSQSPYSGGGYQKSPVSFSNNRSHSKTKFEIRTPAGNSTPTPQSQSLSVV